MSANIDGAVSNGSVDAISTTAAYDILNWMSALVGDNRPLRGLSPNGNVTLGLKVSWRFRTKYPRVGKKNQIPGCQPSPQTSARTTVILLTAKFPIHV